MKKLAILGAVLAGGALATSSFTGCGTEPDNVFDGGENTSSSGASGASGGGSSGCTGLVCDSDGSSGSNGGTSGGVNPFEECGVDKLGGDLLPIELTIVLDKSSSMCAVPGPTNQQTVFDCASPATRWPATSTALNTFLTSPQSAGLTVAVRSFGPVEEFSPNSVAKNRCEPAYYSTLEAGHGPADLPSQPLATAVLADLPPFPNQDGNATMTQTASALRGSLTYTQGRQAALAGAKGVAMLLVSDGKPSGCNEAQPTQETTEDQTAAVAAAQAISAAGIKLYVLNLNGAASFNLDEVAAAGGTQAAITIDNPTDATAINNALVAIRGQTLSCEFPIPTPTNGLKPNYNDLNVTFTPPGGPLEVVAQTTDCATNPNGWQYNNPADPTTIVLCPDVCEKVLASVTGEINVVLGCATVTEPVN